MKFSALWTFAVATAVLILEVNAAVYNLTPNSNWKSTLANLSPGDTVNLADGTYNIGGSYFALTLNGQSGNLITIQGSGGATFQQAAGANAQNILNIQGAWFKIYNVKFTGGSRGIRLLSAHDAIFDTISILSTTGTGFNANDGNQEYYNIQIRNSEVGNTGASTGECFYLGCADNGCRIRNSVIENNYCHDTLDAVGGSQGSAFQIKTGSYANIVRNNVCDRIRGACILFYDDYDQGANTAEGNVVLSSQDNPIQVTSGAIIKNNIVFTAGSGYAGIAISNNQLQSGKNVRNIQVLHNTVYDPSNYGVRFPSNTLQNIVVANNAFFSAQSSAIYAPGSLSGVTFAKNAVLGSVNSGVPASSVVRCTSVDAEVADAANLDVFPVSAGHLVGAGDASKSVTKDFNYASRSSSAPTIGAYEFSASGNAGWQIQSGINPTSSTSTSTPAPSTPAPSTPAPSTPAPSTPAPSTPAPSTPAPSTPAPTGNVYNVGPSENFKAAFANLQAGDTLNLADGVYDLGSSYWKVTLNGEEGNYITVQSEGGAVFNRDNQDQNMLEISGSFFKIIKVQFTGGSRGVRCLPGVHDAVFDGISVTKTTGTAFSANDGSAEYYNLVVRNSIFGETNYLESTTGECLYVGCQEGACRIHDSLIENNYCYNTIGSSGGSEGSAFQVKPGSYNMVVRNNVCNDVKAVCILLYDDYDRGTNIVENNAVLNSAEDIGIQVSAGVIIRNNVVFNTAGAGIAISRNQLQPGKNPRNIRIYHNTVYNTGGTCLYIIGSEMDEIYVANNAFLCQDGVAIRSSASTTNIVYSTNAVLGAIENLESESVAAMNNIEVTDVAATVADADGRNVYPVAGSVLLAAADASYSVVYDFIFQSRATPATVGAYEYTSESNPIGPIEAGLSPTTQPGGPDIGGGGGASTTGSNNDSKTSDAANASFPLLFVVFAALFMLL